MWKLKALEDKNKLLILARVVEEIAVAETQLDCWVCSRSHYGTLFRSLGKGS